MKQLLILLVYRDLVCLSKLLSLGVFNCAKGVNLSEVASAQHMKMLNESASDYFEYHILNSICAELLLFQTQVRLQIFIAHEAFYLAVHGFTIHGP